MMTMKVDNAQGPKELAVLATLAARQANIIQVASPEAQRCFAGFFNGASTRGSITPGLGMKIGKSECERDWERTWPELCRRGLLNWRVEGVANHPSIGGYRVHVYPELTVLAVDVRKDDLAFHRELSDAIQEDEDDGEQAKWATVDKIMKGS